MTDSYFEDRSIDHNPHRDLTPPPVCCCDLFDQGLLQRRKQSLNGKSQRGRPSYVYGLDDFPCVTHTPPLTTVPYIDGEDDPHWPKRQSD